jgi:predicted neutral ceramidase superfamily lipid hydrolase
MGIILGILDFVVVVAVVMSVSRAVWSGQSQSSRSVLLSALIVLVMLVFGVVSFTAAYGLAENSSFNQGALLIFLLAIAIVARMSWADKSAIQP